MKLHAPVSLMLAVLSYCAALVAQSPLENAVTFTKEKRYAEAIQALQGVAEPLVPGQRIAFHRLKAAIASGLNHSADAAAEMQQALALAPGDPSLLFATAIAELAAGHLDPALSVYRGAVKLAPSQEDYPRSFSFELILRQAFRPAIDILRAALPLHPQSTPLRTLLGIAQYAAGDLEDAIATLSEAIALDAHAESAYRSLSQIVLQSSSVPETRVTVQLCGWSPVVCSALKLRLAREHDDPALMREAITALEQSLGANPVVPCELGRAREWTNRLPEARTEMEKCVALNPSPQNHFRLGLIYQRLGLSDLARNQMELRNRVLNGLPEQTTNGLSALGALQ